MTTPETNARGDLRDQLLNTLCDALDLLEHEGSVAQIQLSLRLHADDGSQYGGRAYGFDINLPEKSINIRKENSSRNEKETSRPDSGLYPDGRDFDPDTDSIG